MPDVSGTTRAGADISMTSATKFIAGHSDLTGGLLACNGEELGKRIYFIKTPRVCTSRRSIAG